VIGYHPATPRSTRMTASALQSSLRVTTLIDTGTKR
jgi:hypothetical protein